MLIIALFVGDGMEQHLLIPIKYIGIEEMDEM